MSRMLSVVFSDDLRTACVYEGLPQMEPEMREAWETWLNIHGLDPDVIPVGTQIRCDDVNRRIYYTTYATPKRVIGRHELAKEECFVQLEAPALPFPQASEWVHGQLG